MSQNNYVYYYPQPLLNNELGLTLSDIADSIGVSCSDYNSRMDKKRFIKELDDSLEGTPGRYIEDKKTKKRSIWVFNRTAATTFLKQCKHPKNINSESNKVNYLNWLAGEEIRRKALTETPKEEPQVLEDESLEIRLKKMEEKIRALAERVSDCALTQTEKEVFKDFYEQKCIQLVISYGLSSKKWKHAEKFVLFEVKAKAKLLFGLDKWYLAPQKKFDLMCDIVTAYMPEPKERSEIIKNAEGNPKIDPERSPDEGNTFFGKGAPYN
jgi:hypothetical protein